MPKYSNNKFQSNKKYEKKIPPFEVLMRRFKRDVERSGILKEVKKREFHETRGERNRRKAKEGARRHQKVRRDAYMEQFPNGNVPKALRSKRNF